MTVNTAAESTISIGTTTSATNQSQFEADTYTAVGEVEDLGEFGDQASEVTFTALNNRRVRKFKGSFDAGTLTCVCGKDTADIGQDAMIAAFASDFDYNFRVILNDKLTTSGTGTTLYFRGKVMSKQDNVGAVDNIVRQTFNIGINSAIIEVPAT